METLSYWIGMAGTVAFVVTGVLAVAPKGIDLFSATVLGTITAVGGGTMRDIILDAPVFWSIDQNYIWVSIVASIATFYASSTFSRKKVNKMMLFLDAAGISLFGIQAVDKVWGLGFGLPLAPVLLGVLTAIGGGLIRDVLASRQNLLMSRTLYAIPVLLGCIFYVLILEFLPDYKLVGALIGVFIIFGIRMAAILKDLVVPDWFYLKTE